MNNRNASQTSGELDTRLDSIKESVTTLVDQGKEKAGQLKDRAIEVKDQAVTKGGELLETVTEQIKANPLKSVAIAFGVGYIGMRLFRR